MLVLAVTINISIAVPPQQQLEGVSGNGINAIFLLLEKQSLRHRL